MVSKFCKNFAIVLVSVFVTHALYSHAAWADCPDKRVICIGSEAWMIREIPESEFKTGTCYIFPATCTWCGAESKERADKECKKRFGGNYQAGLKNESPFSK